MENFDLEELDNSDLENLYSIFFDNLNTILNAHQTNVWHKILGVSKSTITNVWPKRDHFPRVDNIIKILAITGVSANWFFFGQGPILIKDAYNEQYVSDNEKRRRKTQEYITKIEKENDTLKALIKNAKYSNIISNLFDQKTDALLGKDSDALDEMTPKQIFDKTIIPMATLISSFNLLSFKFLEKLATSKNGANKLRQIIEGLTEELDTKSLSPRFILKDMDKVFEKIDV